VVPAAGCRKPFFLPQISFYTSMPSNQQQAAEFLHAIFNSKPDSHHILIWELNKAGGEEVKSNNFFLSIDRAAEYATASKPAGTDVYFGVGTLSRKPRYGRGKKDNISGIGAIHLDVDIAHADSRVHKKGNLPPTLDAAVEFVNGIDLKPSIIVPSGYGLHAYWLLQKFWAFDNADDRAAAGKLIETWQRMYKWRAGHHGWDVDATQDITRVLRVPGTVNYKLPDTPVTAGLLHFSPDTRYTPDDLESLLTSMRAQLPPAPEKTSKANTDTRQQAKNVTQLKSAPNAGTWESIRVVLDEGASIPHEIFEALSDNVTNFKRTWQRQRKDLQDTSASAYDMALANMAIAAGLDDQTVCNLLIAHRRKHGDEKQRVDYYQRTIFEARQIMQHTREVRNAALAPVTDNRDDLREQLQRVLGFRIEKIEKQLSDPPQFIIHFAGGRYRNVGDAWGLIDQKTFRRHVANTIGHMVPNMKDVLWEPVTQKLLTLAEDMPISEETTELGEVQEIITMYLDEYLPTNITDTQHRQHAAHHQPAVINGSVCLSGLELWKYAKRNFGTKKSKSELTNLLRRLGAERETHSVRDERGKVRSISVYALPETYTPTGAVKELATGVIAEEDTPPQM
jgi:hypothetical protein